MLSATMCEHLRFKLRCVALRLTQADKSSSTYVSHSLHLLGGGAVNTRSDDWRGWREIKNEYEAECALM